MTECNNWPPVDVVMASKEGEVFKEAVVVNYRKKRYTSNYCVLWKDTRTIDWVNYVKEV